MALTEKDKISRDYAIEKYGITAYKVMANDFVRMEFSQEELSFLAAINVIDSADPELVSINKETCKDNEIFMEYYEYGAQKVLEAVHDEAMEEVERREFERRKSEEKEKDTFDGNLLDVLL